MITNKDVIEQGKIVQHYSIDHNPFTGNPEPDAGFENLVMYDNKIWSVLTDFTGSVANPTGTPDIVTDDAEGFMKSMFYLDESDIEQILEEEVKAQNEADYDEWERWEAAHGIQEIEDDWMRSDDW
jgi:hypothetical protein